MAAMSLWPISTRVSPCGRGVWGGRSAQVKSICWPGAEGQIAKKKKVTTSGAQGFFIKSIMHWRLNHRTQLCGGAVERQPQILRLRFAALRLTPVSRSRNPAAPPSKLFHVDDGVGVGG